MVRFGLALTTPDVGRCMPMDEIAYPVSSAPACAMLSVFCAMLSNSSVAAAFVSGATPDGALHRSPRSSPPVAHAVHAFGPRQRVQPASHSLHLPSAP